MGLAAVFDRARDEHRGVLVGHLPAGFPSFGGCIAALTAMVAAGVDVVAVGLPHHTPVLDPPAIRIAGDQALRSGTRVRDVLRTVEAVAATGVTTLVATYWYPVECYGVPAFARDVSAAGARGLITPDLPPDESGPWLEVSDRHLLGRIFTVSPEFTDGQIRAAADACRGFVLAAAPADPAQSLCRTDPGGPELVARVRDQTSTEVGVNPDVRTGAQVTEVAGYADAVVVSSAFVHRLRDAPDEATGVRRAAALATELVAGTRQPRCAR